MIKSLSQYKEDYRKSIEDPAEFWSEYSKSFFWRKEPGNILSWNFEDPDVKWFFDGKLNITENIFERNKKNENDTAIIWEPNEPNDKIPLVSINGVAGTGKTLLAVAAAISQRRNYKQIFVARPIVPLGNKDIGYLPGDISSKINPYMEPLWDNFKYIQNQYSETSKEFKVLKNMIDSEKLVIQPLAYIRGRSFSNIFFIIDEAQNLTPHEVKTIISRAGENTKIVFAGDINQIDTPYLDSQSNGLSYLIDKLKGQQLYSHVTLRKGERSKLANLANELL